MKSLVGLGRVVAVGVLGLLAGEVSAQESRSATVAKELTALLEKGQLQAIAARDPAVPDRFVAALYFPGVQLLAVSARYVSPPLMAERILKREYRDVYVDLTTASIVESRLMIEDMGANGVFPKRAGDAAFDLFSRKDQNRFAFDGDWKKQKLSEEEYLKAFGEADEAYAHMLATLLTEARR